MPARISRGCGRRATATRALTACRTSPPSASVAPRRQPRCSISSPTSSAIPNSCRSAGDCKVRKRSAEPDGDRDRRRRHDGRLQADPRDLHQPRHARPRRSCRSWSNISTGRSASSRTAGRFEPDRRARLARSSSSSPTNSGAARSALLMGAMFDAAFRRFADGLRAPRRRGLRRKIALITPPVRRRWRFLLRQLAAASRAPRSTERAADLGRGR